MGPNGYSLKDKIIQKWDQITNDLLLQIKNSEENNRRKGEFDYGQDSTKILVEAFLRECN